MAGPASYKTSDVRKKCEDKLRVKFRHKGHLTGWVRVNGKKVARVTIPHGRNPIKKGTLASIRRGMFLQHDEFCLFMQCSIGWDEYNSILKRLGEI